MTTERCDCCIGKKTILGLGALIKKCPKCNGVGHVKIELEVSDTSIDPQDELINEFQDIVKLNKRGRPKKVSNDRIEA